MKIGVFGTCRIDNFNVKDFIKTITVDKYPFIYSNNSDKIVVRPLGYTTTTTDVLQCINVIKDESYKEIQKNKFLYQNILLKHGGRGIIKDLDYDFLVIEVCSLKRIYYKKTGHVFPYEVEGNFNLDDFYLNTETEEETLSNINQIQKTLKCPVILIPPIVNFQGRVIKGEHENVNTDKVLCYRNEIISRLKKASHKKDEIIYLDLNKIINELSIDKSLQDQFHLTDLGKKYLSNSILDICKRQNIRFNPEDVNLFIPEDNHKLHRHHAMFKDRGDCEKSLRVITKKLYDENFLDTSKNIIDLGAWIGDNSIPWAKMIKGKVFAIDPSSENGKYINRLCNINNIHNIKLITKCISDKKETVYSNDNLIHAQFNTTSGQNSINTTTLDSLIKEKVIDNIEYIHLDVESFEYKVLIGSSDLINEYLPAITWEHHLGESDTKLIIEFLKQKGYCTFLINERFPHCRPDCRNFISTQVDKKDSLLNICKSINTQKTGIKKGDDSKDLLIQYD
jgi:FkbM family methyltransferase